MNTLGTRRSRASGTLDEVVWSKSSGVRMFGLAGALFGATGPGAGAGAAAAAAGARVAAGRGLPPPALLGRGGRTLDSGVVAMTLTSGSVTSGLALSARAGPKAGLRA